MCITATANPETGVTLSLHLPHGTACLSLDEDAAAHLLNFIQAPLLFPSDTTRVGAHGHYPGVAGRCLYEDEFPVTGMTVVRSTEGYTLHAHLVAGAFKRPDGRTPALFTVPADELQKLLAPTGNC
ncbi:hypothetical protein AB0J83_03385 [Actinoplanes sp. NPDC049596]|uniref:hypothetical protein n=1 Tax=unclassified Actinoplanes TaxID=2626549 RepID=UPI0034360FF7